MTTHKLAETAKTGRRTKPILITRATAIHEAGHAIANHCYGLGFVEAELGPIDYADFKGNPIIALGRCRSGFYFTDHKEPIPFSEYKHPDHRAHTIDLACRVMTAALAGGAAEARFRKLPYAAVLVLAGGRDDFGICREIADWLGDKTLLETACKQAQKFVRGAVAWDAINAFTDLLLERKFVTSDDEEVRAILNPLVNTERQNQ